MKPEVLKMFDDEYRKRAPLFGSIPTQVVVRLRALLKDTARVLDLGAGDGRDSLYLLQAGFHVTALDLSGSAIAALKRLAAEKHLEGRLEAQVMDVRSWMPTSNSFDAIVGITILDHVEQGFHPALFENMLAALREGGYVALEMHSDRDPSVSPQSRNLSEFAVAVCTVARANSLILPFLNGWRILEYSDRQEHDVDHGEPHDHGFCTIMARKESLR